MLLICPSARPGTTGAARPAARSAGSGDAGRSTTWTRSSTTWTRRATAVAAGLLASLVALGPGTAHASPPAAGPVSQYVVRAQHGQLPALRLDLRRTGTVLRQVPLVDAEVVLLHRADALRFSHDPRVASVTPDGTVRLAGAAAAAGGAPQSLADVADDVGASALWDRGITGRGVDVALIDSGIAPVPGLTGAKVVYGPDLSFDSQDSETRHTDGFGHGTHLAGIIAGRSAAKGFSGIAPGARLVSVKVADAVGNADVSQVIAGIDWVVQHADTDGLHIRVLNLSFGTDASQAYTVDPLAYAAEQAWHAGIVVVVSGGNAGSSGRGLTNPARDPYLLAVGASDTSRRTPVVASFSSRGDGVRNPDLVAPGVRITSLAAPGSTIDGLYGSRARTGDGLFRGSGTSQASAVVAGAAALLLEARPTLSPDQVKGLLTGTARDLRGKAQAQGAGLLEVADAAEATAPEGVQTFARSTGTGSLEAARGSVHIGAGDAVLDGERDIFGNEVDTADLATLEASRSAWKGAVFNGRAWTGSGSDSSSWGSQSWAGQAWAGQNWAGQAWASQAWASQNWASQAWGAGGWR